MSECIQGYGDTGTHRLAQVQTLSVATPVPIPAAGTTATLILDNPFPWTIARGSQAGCDIAGRCGVVGDDGMRFSFDLQGAATAGLVSVILAVILLDGQGNIIETVPVGEVDPRALATLSCGNEKNFSGCVLWRFPRNPRNTEKALGIGAAQYENLAIIVSNNNTGVADTVTVTVTVDIEATDLNCECKG